MHTDTSATIFRRNAVAIASSFAPAERTHLGDGCVTGSIGTVTERQRWQIEVRGAARRIESMHKTLPMLAAAALLLGSASIASAQQSNPANPPTQVDEQDQPGPGQPTVRTQQRPGAAGQQGSGQQGAGQVQGQTPATTGAATQGSMDKGKTGFQNEPDHTKKAAE
jgi:hypothetical protein